MAWCSNYVRGGYLYPDFYKPELPPSDQFPYQRCFAEGFQAAL